MQMQPPETPEPPDGGARDQVAAVASEVLPKIRDKVAASSVRLALQDIVSSRPRGIGAPGEQVVVAYLHEQAEQISRLEGQLHDAHTREREMHLRYTDSQVANARMHGLLGARTRTGNILKGVGVLSGILVALGTDLLKTPGDRTIGFIVVAIGGLGLLVTSISIFTKESE